MEPTRVLPARATRGRRLRAVLDAAEAQADDEFWNQSFFNSDAESDSDSGEKERGGGLSSDDSALGSIASESDSVDSDFDDPEDVEGDSDVEGKDIGGNGDSRRASSVRGGKRYADPARKKKQKKKQRQRGKDKVKGQSSKRQNKVEKSDGEGDVVDVDVDVDADGNALLGSSGGKRQPLRVAKSDRVVRASTAQRSQQAMENSRLEMVETEKRKMRLEAARQRAQDRRLAAASITQDELLAEAERTEELNAVSLEGLMRLADELKAPVVVRNSSIEGPHIRWVSRTVKVVDEEAFNDTHEDGRGTLEDGSGTVEDGSGNTPVASAQGDSTNKEDLMADGSNTVESSKSSVVAGDSGRGPVSSPVSTEDASSISSAPESAAMSNEHFVSGQTESVYASSSSANATAAGSASNAGLTHAVYCEQTTVSFIDTSVPDSLRQSILSGDKLPPTPGTKPGVRYSKGLNSRLLPSKKTFACEAYLCPVTGFPARYWDPQTGIPYFNLEALRAIRAGLTTALTKMPLSSDDLAAGEDADSATTELSVVSIPAAASAPSTIAHAPAITPTKRQPSSTSEGEALAKRHRAIPT